MTVLLDESNPSSARVLVFELAPVDLMPHSVHLFLSQIAEGYWSCGTPAFVLAAEHVLQACPHPCLDHVDLGGSKRGYPYAEMREAGLDSVSFQEYSPKFPHKRHTIGFAGRPHSGPEFYVNLLDNTLDHGTAEERRRSMGPKEYEAWAGEAFDGGAEEAGTTTEPYPCFGRLVEGRDVADEIARGMTRASLRRRRSEDDDDDSEEEDGPGLENTLLRPVRIASVTILENYDPGIALKGAEGEEEDGKGGGSASTSDEL
eukprot:CAMPEP_0172539242 /NCGR_PEP_ID=MMETSP1067-20121228/10481_1 /TAXON_ID=265564 ORGANISM="Thalassiosira punctigera, Strain Tpunct2005C2" /NCGR_SAMPLE_ID=MMETSP1067 /ASSEMBLY_ACC=CAM_ASM_000444 /LENGTH=258 /DNA_ID=CAMNT_0013324889 /DNA_START=68 /DNA_END=844 /DNA_ORIENTATION=-